MAMTRIRNDTPALVTLGPWHINDLPGTATTEAVFLFMNTTTAVSQGATGRNDYRMPLAGRIVGAFIETDDPRTAGTATVRLRLNAVDTAFASGGAALDASNTTRDSHTDTGVAFAAGDRIGVNVTTSGWTPTTANVRVTLLARMEWS